MSKFVYPARIGDSMSLYILPYSILGQKAKFVYSKLGVIGGDGLEETFKKIGSLPKIKKYLEVEKCHE